MSFFAWKGSLQSCLILSARAPRFVERFGKVRDVQVASLKTVPRSCNGVGTDHRVVTVGSDNSGADSLARHS
jgi:hypothetical protein